MGSPSRGKISGHAAAAAHTAQVEAPEREKSITPNFHVRLIACNPTIRSRRRALFPYYSDRVASDWFRRGWGRLRWLRRPRVEQPLTHFLIAFIVLIARRASEHVRIPAGEGGPQDARRCRGRAALKPRHLCLSQDYECFWVVEPSTYSLLALDADAGGSADWQARGSSKDIDISLADVSSAVLPWGTPNSGVPSVSACSPSVQSLLTAEREVFTDNVPLPATTTNIEGMQSPHHSSSVKTGLTCLGLAVVAMFVILSLRYLRKIPPFPLPEYFSKEEEYALPDQPLVREWDRAAHDLVLPQVPGSLRLQAFRAVELQLSFLVTEPPAGGVDETSPPYGTAEDYLSAGVLPASEPVSPGHASADRSGEVSGRRGSARQWLSQLVELDPVSELSAAQPSGSVSQYISESGSGSSSPSSNGPADGQPTARHELELRPVKADSKGSSSGEARRLRSGVGKQALPLGRKRVGVLRESSKVLNTRATRRRSAEGEEAWGAPHRAPRRRQKPPRLLSIDPTTSSEVVNPQISDTAYVRARSDRAPKVYRVPRAPPNSPLAFDFQSGNHFPQAVLRSLHLASQPAVKGMKGRGGVTIGALAARARAQGEGLKTKPLKPDSQRNKGGGTGGAQAEGQGSAAARRGSSQGVSGKPADASQQSEGPRAGEDRSQLPEANG
ncbi:hypothetical protein Efla_003984 [Eimeria flavescens]